MASIPIELLVGFLFLAGLMVGSFLNVIIHRLNSGQSVVSGRSHCDACGRTLSWQELIPVVSFFIQRGRSRCCNIRLSYQYPLVELATAMLFAGAVLVLGPSWQLFGVLVVTAILVVITVYDYRHLIIPNGLVALLLSLGVMFGLAELFISIPILNFDERWWLHVVAAIVIPAPFFLLWIFSKGRLMGLGDIKLMIPIGLFLGLELGGTALILSFWLGALVALGLGVGALYQRIRGKKAARWFGREIPFGPYLCMAFWFVLVFRLTIVDITIWLLS